MQKRQTKKRKNEPKRIPKGAAIQIHLHNHIIVIIHYLFIWLTAMHTSIHIRIRVCYSYVFIFIPIRILHKHIHICIGFFICNSFDILIWATHSFCTHHGSQTQFCFFTLCFYIISKKISIRFQLLCIYTYIVTHA